MSLRDDLEARILKLNGFVQDDQSSFKNWFEMEESRKQEERRDWPLRTARTGGDQPCFYACPTASWN